MSITELFSKIGAPLNNSRWSWGAVSANGDVILRVWGDTLTVIDGKRYVRVTHEAAYADNRENLGYQERLEHVALIADGARCFCILCKAKDKNARPRELESFDQRTLLVGGRLVDYNGDKWLELADRIAVGELRKGNLEGHRLT